MARADFQIVRYYNEDIKVNGDVRRMRLTYPSKPLKRLLPGVWMCSMLLLGLPALAQSQPETPLSRMEQQLFARTYPSDTSAARLNRLESLVFGVAKTTGSEADRIRQLEQFFQQNTPTAQAPPSQQQHLPAAQNPPPVANPQNVQPDSGTVLSGETAYPTVSAMERKIFGRTYETMPITQRLGQLERQVLRQEQQGDLQARTDQLRMMILGDAEATAINPPSSTQADRPAATSADPAEIVQALPNVERRVLRQVYPQDTLENRLSRLEQRLFNASAPEMSPEERFYRIVGVAEAQSSGRRQTALRNGGGMMIRPGGVYGPGMGGTLMLDPLSMFFQMFMSLF